MTEASWLDEALRTCGAYRLVDRVEREGEGWLDVAWTVPHQASFHRTDGAERLLLLPGTVTLEHLVQAGEALIWRLRGRSPDEGVPVLGRLRWAKFRGMVRPGDVLRSTVRFEAQTGPAFEVAAESRVEDAVVVRAQMAFTVADLPRVAEPAAP